MRMGQIVIVVCGLFVATACGSSNPTTPTMTPATAAVSIPAGARTLGTAAYAPNPITVTAGSTVTWTNTDSIAHTTTSDSPMFDSGTMNPGATYNFTFQTKGTFPYHCSFHRGMVASVVVQ
jgi:plastocyanin